MPGLSRKKIARAWVSGRAIDHIEHESIRRAPLEAGGVLLGYSVGALEFVITHATASGPQAIHERERYVPDYEWDEAEIARIYRETGRHSTYLGDWHSHPEGTHEMSDRDLKTLRRIGEHRSARAPAPIMLIAAGDEPWSISARALTPGRWISSRKIVDLSLVRFEEQ